MNRDTQERMEKVLPMLEQLLFKSTIPILLTLKHGSLPITRIYEMVRFYYARPDYPALKERIKALTGMGWITFRNDKYELTVKGGKIVGVIEHCLDTLIEATH